MCHEALSLIHGLSGDLAETDSPVSCLHLIFDSLKKKKNLGSENRCLKDLIQLGNPMTLSGPHWKFPLSSHPQADKVLEEQKQKKK